MGQKVQEERHKHFHPDLLTLEDGMITFFEMSGNTHPAKEGHIREELNPVLYFSGYFSRIQTNVVIVRKLESPPIFPNLAQIIHYTIFF
jgi:hypothetical protein